MVGGATLESPLVQRRCGDRHELVAATVQFGREGFGRGPKVAGAKQQKAGLPGARQRERLAHVKHSLFAAAG